MYDSSAVRWPALNSTPPVCANTTVSFVVGTTAPQPVLTALWVDFMPNIAVPFANGTAYIDLLSPTASTVGSLGATSTLPATYFVTFPGQPSALNVSLIWQAVAFEQTGAISVSNGIVTRIGAI